jgi:hypothetical protein
MWMVASLSGEPVAYVAVCLVVVNFPGPSSLMIPTAANILMMRANSDQRFTERCTAKAYL